MEIKIGNRTIPLVLTAYEMQDIQKDIGCTVGQLRDDVFAVVHHPEADTENGESEYTIELMKDAEKVRKLGTLIRIMGNAGLEEAGQEPDLTEKWIMRHMSVAKVMVYAVAMMAAVNAAMHMESAENDNGGPVDEVLAEENRKKEQGN